MNFPGEESRGRQREIKTVKSTNLIYLSDWSMLQRLNRVVWISCWQTWGLRHSRIDPELLLMLKFHCNSHRKENLIPLYGTSLNWSCKQSEQHEEFSRWYKNLQKRLTAEKSSLALLMKIVVKLLLSNER